MTDWDRWDTKKIVGASRHLTMISGQKNIYLQFTASSVRFALIAFTLDKTKHFLNSKVHQMGYQKSLPSIGISRLSHQIYPISQIAKLLFDIQFVSITERVHTEYRHWYRSSRCWHHVERSVTANKREKYDAVIISVGWCTLRVELKLRIRISEQAYRKNQRTGTGPGIEPTQYNNAVIIIVISAPSTVISTAGWSPLERWHSCSGKQHTITSPILEPLTISSFFPTHPL